MLTSTNNFQNENTFTIESKEDLILSFRGRDQKKLLLPIALQFPIRIRSYLAWKESSGVYTYLIFKNPNWDLPRGVTFKRMAVGDSATGGLCGWCHSYGGNDEIGMLSAAMNSEVSCGYILCHDLRCIEKIEELAALAGKNPEVAIHQLYERIQLFFDNLSSYKPE